MLTLDRIRAPPSVVSLTPSSVCEVEVWVYSPRVAGVRQDLLSMMSDELGGVTGDTFSPALTTRAACLTATATDLQVDERWSRRLASAGGIIARVSHDEAHTLVWDTSLEVHMLREEVLVLQLTNALQGYVVVLPEWFVSTVPDVAPPSGSLSPMEAIIVGNRCVGRVGWSFQRGGPVAWYCVAWAMAPGTVEVAEVLLGASVSEVAYRELSPAERLATSLARSATHLVRGRWP